MPNSKFQLGQIVSTPGALEAITSDTLSHALTRHASGDWGDLLEDDQAENDLALQEGFRILSAYHYEGSPKFWIITEADRSATTILLPDEY